LGVKVPNAEMILAPNGTQLLLFILHL